MAKRDSPPPGDNRRGPSWIDERHTSRGDMRMQQAFSKLRADAAYEAAEACERCEEERRSSGDDSALCEAHLARAMGMGSRWP